MEKKFCRLIGVVLWMFSIMPGWAQTPTGTTCEDAIPLGSEYQGPVPSAGVYWYKACTYDLPLRIHFRPSDTESDIAPVVQVDFTCTPGVYDDPQLDSLINQALGWGYSMPLEFSCNLVVVDGHNEYDLSVGKTYRDLLASLGYTDNVTAYVRVEYGGGGAIDLAPDTAFSSCMDRGKLVSLGSSLSILPNNPDTFFIFPMTKWHNDSVRLIWRGAESAMVYLSTICDYEPDPFDDANKIYDVFSIAPNDTFKLSKDDVQDALDWPENNGGLFYAKIISNTSGSMKIEQIPMSPPAEGAVLLKYNTETQITALDTMALYAIPKTWVEATLFTSPTDYRLDMEMGITPDFTTEKSDKNYIGHYKFSKLREGHELGFTKEQMNQLWQHTDGNYIYIRFKCTQNTQILPLRWAPPECIVNNTLLVPDSTYAIPRQSKQVFYTRYNEWIGGDMQVSWTGSMSGVLYVADTCSFIMNPSAEHIVTTQQVGRQTTKIIPQRDVESWAYFLAPDAYVYFILYSSMAGNMTISTTAPEEQDPEPIVYPSATISVVCEGEMTAMGQPFIVRVSQEQDLHLEGGEQWHQTPDETYTFTLSPGIYMLHGANESVEITVK